MDDKQPSENIFPSLEFESRAGVWQPRQTYKVAETLASGEEVRLCGGC